MRPTNRLRHVWREINDGNRDIKVLAIKQWWQGESGGEWIDVEIDNEIEYEDRADEGNK